MDRPLIGAVTQGYNNTDATTFIQTAPSLVDVLGHYDTVRQLGLASFFHPIFQTRDGVQCVVPERGIKNRPVMAVCYINTM